MDYGRLRLEGLDSPLLLLLAFYLLCNSLHMFKALLQYLINNYTECPTIIRIKMNVHTSLNHGLIQHGRPFSLSCPVALSKSCPNLITYLICSLIILQFIFLQVHILASPMCLLFKLKVTG